MSIGGETPPPVTATPQGLAQFPEADSQRFGRFCNAGMDGRGGPFRQPGQRRAHRRQRLAHHRSQDLPGRLFVQFDLMAERPSGRFGHPGQRFGALAPCFRHFFQRRAVPGIQADVFELRLKAFAQDIHWRRLHVLLIDPVQLVRVQSRGGCPQPFPSETGNQLLYREDFLVAVRPAEPGQVVEHRIRQVAGVQVVQRVGRFFAFGQLFAVRRQQQRQMAILRRRPAQGLNEL